MGQPARTAEYFNYLEVAQRAKIAEADVAAIEAIVRQDYANDQMMFELRMLRVCRAIERGSATVDDALRPDRSSAA
jgi:hypothetical protein